MSINQSTVEKERKSSASSSKEDFENEIPEDFLFMLDVSREIDDAFKWSSDQRRLARKWMEFLCTYKAETLADRRLKNVYLSHLVAALYQGQLYGPFVKAPKDKLEKVDFYATSKKTIPGTDMTLVDPWTQSTPMDSAATLDDDDVESPDQPRTSAKEQSQAGISAANESGANQAVDVKCMSKPRYQGACACPPRPCDCGATGACQCTRRTGGAEFNANTNFNPPFHNNNTNRHHKPGSSNKEDVICNYLMQELNFTPDFLMEFDATLTSFMNLCNLKCIEGRTALLNNPSLITKAAKANTSLPTAETAAAAMSANNSQHPTQYYQQQQQQQQQEHHHHRYHHHHHHNRNILDNCTPDESHLPNQTSDNIASGIPSSSSNEYSQINMNELLQAIAAELRGDAEPGNNDILERELSRYKPFLMSKPNYAKHLEKLKSGMKLRHFLLLSLQKDLIKVFSDTI